MLEFPLMVSVEANSTPFGENVKRERKRTRMSQAKLAKALNDKGFEAFYPTTVAKIEAGSREARIGEASAMADAFGVTVDFLLGRTVDPQAEADFARRTAADTLQRIPAQLDQFGIELRGSSDDLEPYGWDEVRRTLDTAATALQKVSDELRRRAWFPLADVESQAAFAELGRDVVKQIREGSDDEA